MSFRRFLQSELGARSRANPRFSLRAFARRIGVDHSTLSQILRGKRRAGAAQIASVGRRLGLTTEQVASLVRSDQGAVAFEAAERRAFAAMVRDLSRLLTEPLHFAILELLATPGVQCDSRWLAAALGASVDEVNVALTRMLAFGLVRMEGRRVWVDVTSTVGSRLREFARNAMTHGAAAVVETHPGEQTAGETVRGS